MIWRHLDADGSGNVTHHEFALFVYRVELSTWPTLSKDQLVKVVKVLSASPSSKQQIVNKTTTNEALYIYIYIYYI